MKPKTEIPIEIVERSSGFWIVNIPFLDTEGPFTTWGKANKWLQKAEKAGFDSPTLH